MNSKSFSFLTLFVALALLQSSGREAVAQADVKLRSGDFIELRIAGVPASEVSLFSTRYLIADDGTLNLPHIGKIKVSGLGITEIQSRIQNAYVSADIYTNPTVMVVVQTGDRFITVGGDVKSPGRVPYTNDLTLLTAINASGGFTEFANQGKVRLLRGNKGYEVDVKKIRGNPQDDIKLLPGDKVEVPRSFF